jgi:D-serine deaminase-like pyridoxal phosphate-dependent protein
MTRATNTFDLPVERPTLLLDRKRVLHNISRMVEKARASGVKLRPHFKTHQSATIGEWFRSAGVDRITVSSVDMATYFATDGWTDITIAFPVNVRQLHRIDELASQIHLGLLVESPEIVETLSKQLSHPVDLWIKIDTGYGRTGIKWSEPVTVTALAQAITVSEQLRLQGILCHAGHSYKARSHKEVRAIYNESTSRMQAVQAQLTQAGFNDVSLSMGDTPTCSVVEQFEGVDEIRPGNFVFYDLTQLAIGSCTQHDIAVALACPVVAKHVERGEIVVYGGAVHLSKDFLPLPDGRKCFGQVALRDGRGWGRLHDDVYVTSVSQEHGMIMAPTAFIEQLHIGDLLMIVPVHSCLTADVMKRYLSLDGEQIAMMDAR